jgi:hypothetical protein
LLVACRITLIGFAVPYSLVAAVPAAPPARSAASAAGVPGRRRSTQPATLR